MPLQPPLRERKRLATRLPEHPSPELPSRLGPLVPHDRVIDAAQRALEPALAQPRQGVRARPPQVWVREVQLRLPVRLPAPVRVSRVAGLGGTRAEDAGAGEEQVDDDLDVQRPVVRVVED